MPTLGDVLAHVNRSVRGEKQFQPGCEIQVCRTDGKPLKIVRNDYGRFGIQQEGTAQEVFLSMLHEVDAMYVRPNGVVRKPHEMSRSDWEAVTAIGSAAFNVYPCFSADQFSQKCIWVDEKGANPVSLDWFCTLSFMERFGYGHNGPLINREVGTNCRHEVHVAYALASGEQVPEAVLDYYRVEAPNTGASDLDPWFKALLNIPQLRGKLPFGQLRQLCSTLRHEKIELTNENAPFFIGLMSDLPDDPTYVEMDDFLYGEDVFKAYPVPQAPKAEVDPNARPLALLIRQKIGEYRRDKEIERCNQERAKGHMSLREFSRHVGIANQYPETETLAWGNKIADAVEAREIAFLLDILDTPDDANTISKKAICEIFGLKLLGLKAAARRQAIFEFCGYDSEKVAQYEQALRNAAEKASHERSMQDAETRASNAKWRVSGGEVISGKEYVDRAVAEGYTTIYTTRKGKALQYWLADISSGRSKNVLAKDGTLDYARLVHGLKEEPKAA
jgi:hypothetical protein